MALVGEPGIGKSRLFYEFIHSRGTRGCLVLQSSPVSYGKATPYLPIIELLRAYFKIQERDGHREIREKIAGKLLSLDESLKRTLSAFHALLDVPIEDPDWRVLDSFQRRQRTLEAIKLLLFRESQLQPLLLVLDDLHWIDSESQAVLDTLVDSLPSASILILVNYRPEYQHSWGNKTYYTQLRLDALPLEGAEELLQALLGNDASVLPVKQLLIERTEGNPFFLEESVRSLVETKVLEGERGNYRLAREIESAQVPATVQAVLAARIDRVPPEEKHLLQSASVIGKDVPFVLLQAIADQPEEEVRRGIAHLQAAEFLYETTLFPDPEYTFKHALTHEVAYGSVLQERRRLLHARIVDIIERLYPDRLTEQVEQLAHHAFLGEVWEKAATYLRRAGKKAEGFSAHRQAVFYFEQALSALKNLPETREKVEQAIDLRFDLRNSLLPLGELDQILDYLREAEILATTLNNPRPLAQVSCYMTQYFWVTRNHDGAISSGQRALAIASALADLAVQVETNFYLGAAYYNLGEYRRAVGCLSSNVESLIADLIYERFGMPFLPSVTSRTWLVWSLAELGEFTEGTAKGEEAIGIAEKVNHPFSMIDGYLAVGVLRLHRGELERATLLLERALEISQVWHIPLLFPWVASPLGFAYALSGRVAEALPLLEQAVDQASSIKLMTNQSRRLAMLGEAYLLGGRLDEATSRAQEAFEFSLGYKERGQQAYVLRLIAEIAAHKDPSDIEEPEDYYRQALALAEELEMRPLMAQCHLGFGTMYRRIGKQRQAKEQFVTATAMMRDMEMGLWLEKAEAELKELG